MFCVNCDWNDRFVKQFLLDLVGFFFLCGCFCTRNFLVFAQNKQEKTSRSPSKKRTDCWAFMKIIEKTTRGHTCIKWTTIQVWKYQPDHFLLGKCGENLQSLIDFSSSKMSCMQSRKSAIVEYKEKYFKSLLLLKYPPYWNLQVSRPEWGLSGLKKEDPKVFLLKGDKSSKDMHEPTTESGQV